MEVSKVLLYCTKAKPWLFKGRSKYKLYDSLFCKNNGYMTEATGYLNGSVCFECDCKEAFIIFPNFGAGNPYFTKYIDDSKLLSRLGMNDIGMLISYAKGKDTYAYHSENVNPIAPMPITQLYKDEDCTIPLTKAPQSYCFAYREKIIYHDWGEPKKKVNLAKIVEKVLVFSIRSPWLCKIANGEKDLEVRKTRIANAGIEYK